MKTLAVVLFLLFFSHVSVQARDFVMSTHFYAYEEACFNSGVISRFGPQTVQLAGPIRDDGWARISTFRGYGWVNVHLAPLQAELQGHFRRYGNDVAVFYKNLSTGFTFVHNPNRIFFAASVNKALHAFYVFHLAELGLIDLYAEHVYTSARRWGGTGTLQFSEVGRVLTTRELLALSVRESDNAAFRWLVDMTRNKTPSYADFVRQMGRDRSVIRDVVSQTTHAVDAGLWMYAIFNYIEGESRFGHYFKYDLMNTAETSHRFMGWHIDSGMVGSRVDVTMIRSSYEMARKYGWYRNAFHDAAIVYAGTPYILVILTNMYRGAHGLFAEISEFVENFNRRHFAPPPVSGFILIY